MIRFLEQEEIDTQAWDYCINHSAHPVVYAYSWYLDNICDTWGALVLNEYEAVFPLPYAKKFGVFYVYQPYFCQQLGLFSRVPAGDDLLRDFLNAIPNRFKLIDLAINKRPIDIKNLKWKERANYRLDLVNPYEDLISNFTTMHRRNIRKSYKNDLSIAEQVDSASIISLYRKYYGNTTPGIIDIHFTYLNRLLANAYGRAQIVCPAVIGEGNRIVAGGIFLSDRNAIYYMLGAGAPDAKNLGAMYALIDYVIRKYASSGLILDFEGSDMPGIAQFFEGFGSTKTSYYQIRWNRLPFPFSLLKK